MEISLEKLSVLVNEAYERGLIGCADLKKQEIEELFNKYQISEADEFRVWKVDVLKGMAAGSIFHHIIRGRCWIVESSNGRKFMQFRQGQAIEFNSDSDPWDKPMRLLHTE